jgi:hypothetical protein
MAQSSFFNIDIAPNGKPGPSSSGDSGAGHVTVSWDSSKLTTTGVSLEALLLEMRLAFRSRGFR